MKLTHQQQIAILSDGSAELGLDIDLQQIEQLLAYTHLILKWNKTHNLTAITQIDAMLVKHILDSLSISRFLPEGNVLDVGSGAGLPGIPLSIVNTNKQFTLVDSSLKRVAFLKEVKRKLLLTNVYPIHSRIEALDAGKFNIITSRAFSSIAEMMAQTAHLLADNGCWLPMKGSFPALELEEVSAHYNIKTSTKLQVPGLDAERHLIEIVCK